MNNLEKAQSLEKMFSIDDLDEVSVALRSLHWRLGEEIKEYNGTGRNIRTIEAERETTEVLLNIFNGAIDIKKEKRWDYNA